MNREWRRERRDGSEMGARLKPLHRTKHGGPGRWEGARWNFLGGMYDFDALLGWVDVIFVE